MTDELHVPIHNEYDIVTARHRVRELCISLNFSRGEQTLEATAVSELARNIVEYAEVGEMIMMLDEEKGEKGIVIIAEDEGPGIADVDMAMKDGYSTSNGLGLGLPGCRRIMDDFEIVSAVGRGTRVTVKKWKRK